MKRILCALSGGITSVSNWLLVRTPPKIIPAVLLSFIVMFVAVSLILATSPVFSIDRPEDDVILNAALKAYQREDYSAALQKFSELSDKYPKTPLRDVALFWTARAYFKIGNQMEAARNMSQLIKQYPGTPLSGYAEDGLLELVSRYDLGEQLATSSTKATLSEGSKPTVPTAKIEQDAPLAAQAKSGVFIKKINVGESFIDIISDNRLEAYKAIRLVQPERLVIDIPEAKSALATKSVSVNRWGISKVRIGVSAAAARIVLDAAHSPFPAYDIKPTEKGLRVTIAPLAAEPKILVPASTDSGKRSVVLVKEVTASESSIDIVTGNSLEAYKSFRLAKPERLVIDIPNAMSTMAAKSILINRLGISKVRIGVNAATTRIVLDAAHLPFPPYDIKPSENGLRIKLSPLVAESNQPASTSTESGIRNSVLVKEIIAGESNIDIVTGNSLEAYKTFKLAKPDRLVIDIPGAKCANAAKCILINRLGVSRVRIGIRPAAVRIVLDASHSLFPAYDIKPFDGGLRIKIAN